MTGEQATRPLVLDPDRCFSPEPGQRRLARGLYEQVSTLPIVSPHGHVDPRLFADEGASWGSPADLLIIPDHYVFRMLYSRGTGMGQLGIKPQQPGESWASEQDHRAVWQRFAENFYLFRGTPTGYWLRDELANVFGIDTVLDAHTAQPAYERIEQLLSTPEYRPRALFDRFNIEVLCTTDKASDSLEHHERIANSAWGRNAQGQLRVRPTFRPDAVVNLDSPGWKTELNALGVACGQEIAGYRAFIRALEDRRSYFKAHGATATDHAAITPYTEYLDEDEAEQIFGRALSGDATSADAARFTGHMLIEMARMSTEDGLVMQLHAGSYRSHNPLVASRFGRDMGADIPVATEWTCNLRELLARYGNDPRLTLILFTLDESGYSRELAPLAGHYPALRLGPPWWFHDSFNGMRRYFDLVVETAGLYNTTGFNDDTRAFPSIPARHDLWRRTVADWVAGLLVRGLIDEHDAEQMTYDASYGLAKQVYGLG